jgi:hypothetical protein
MVLLYHDHEGEYRFADLELGDLCECYFDPAEPEIKETVSDGLLTFEELKKL